jgi:AAHS family 4-hydroxybenzoate transporter-like MFS transporter
VAERVLDVGALIETRTIGPAQWTVIGLCAFVAMLDGMDLQSIGLAAPAISAQLQIAPQAFGVVFSAALAGLALGAFLLGPVADRVGRKRVLVGATFCFGVFALTTAYAGNVPELLAARFLTGVGLGGAMPSFISLASEYVPKARRPKRSQLALGRLSTRRCWWAGYSDRGSSRPTDGNPFSLWAAFCRSCCQ